MIIENGMVFTEENKFVQKNIFVADDKIVDSQWNQSIPDCDIHNKMKEMVIDANNCYVIPGLTDIHFHGCAGYDFCDGTKEAIQAIATYEASQGITTICPATMTLPEETLSSICELSAHYVSEQLKGIVSKNTATLVGINMEGPFISFDKRGAQNPAYIRTPDLSMYKRLQEKSCNLLKLIAIAPEVENAFSFIKETKNEIVLSIAHTSADYDTVCKAFHAGASHVTHLYNAMPPFTHRSPSVIGAAFDHSSCNVELICDGIHIAPSVIRATFQLFGDDRIILISDSMMATGMEDGQYALGGQEVKVKGNLATLADGTIAGSVTNLMDCVRYAVSIGIPLESAIKCATVNPTKSIGIYQNYGSITSGKFANLVILDKNLSIKTVILNGRIIYS